ncbi:MAG: hypothetical protein IPK50_13815 [Fibrobacterota bacterium]|nr:MAG: hypothetical protein IPK50_13815 [Fibrobacterota bacterium]
MILYEHERIRVGEKSEGDGLTKPVFDALAAWQERNQVRYLEIGHRSIRATQWVGILQVGRTVLEILPKADVHRGLETGREESSHYWRRVLLEMLAAAKGFELRKDQRADQELQHHTLLEVIFWLFVNEAEKLLREGLAKTYRLVARNRTAWRGHLLVAKDLHQNLVHRELVYTESMEYDLHNHWNRILVTTLDFVAHHATDPLLRARSKSSLLPFQDWSGSPIKPELFDRLRYDRRTERYRQAMELAKLILLQQNPDLSAGSKDVYSLLFDMNKLWEAWVAQRIRHSIKGTGWTLKTQSSAKFWIGGESERKLSARKVRPDLVLSPPQKFKELPSGLGLPALRELTVLDTKWKVMSSWVPDDGDLKQMFVYNHLWGAKEAWLLYPKRRGANYPTSVGVGGFLGATSIAGQIMSSHCGVSFFDLPPERMSLKKNAQLPVQSNRVE